MGALGLGGGELLPGSVAISRQSVGQINRN